MYFNVFLFSLLPSMLTYAFFKMYFSSSIVIVYSYRSIHSQVDVLCFPVRTTEKLEGVEITYIIFLLHLHLASKYVLNEIRKVNKRNSERRKSKI